MGVESFNSESPRAKNWSNLFGLILSPEEKAKREAESRKMMREEAESLRLGLVEHRAVLTRKAEEEAVKKKTLNP